MNGSILRIVDFPPVSGEIKVDNKSFTAEMGIGEQKRGGGKHINHPFMHRTKSIDYAIVLEGEIDMLLDDTEVHMKAGDIMVQQGTNHAWVNNSGKNCRICFVLIGAHEPGRDQGPGRRALAPSNATVIASEAKQSPSATSEIASSARMRLLAMTVCGRYDFFQGMTLFSSSWNSTEVMRPMIPIVTMPTNM